MVKVTSLRFLKTPWPRGGSTRTDSLSSSPLCKDFGGGAFAAAPFSHLGSACCLGRDDRHRQESQRQHPHQAAAASNESVKPDWYTTALDGFSFPQSGSFAAS